MNVRTVPKQKTITTTNVVDTKPPPVVKEDEVVEQQVDAESDTNNMKVADNSSLTHDLPSPSRDRNTTMKTTTTKQIVNAFTTDKDERVALDKRRRAKAALNKNADDKAQSSKSAVKQFVIESDFVDDDDDERVVVRRRSRK